MPRRVLAMALLLAAAPAVAAETVPTPVVQPARETQPEPKSAAASERKATQRQAGEAPKNSRGAPQPPSPLLEEKNLGLGCAQG